MASERRSNGLVRGGIAGPQAIRRIGAGMRQIASQIA